MPVNQTIIVAQIDALLERCNEIRKRSEFDNLALSDVPTDEATEIMTLVVAAIERFAPPNSRYIENLSQYLRHPTFTPYFGTFVGILKALRADYAAGNLQAITELIHADIFSDFLEMAEYLLEQGYKDPSAVITGSVLEEHLRKLCIKNGIAIIQGNRPKKADTINAELAAVNVFSKLDQKNITAWLDLRNKAAHGKYDEYSKEQVALLIQSIRDFITRHPA